MDTPEQLAAEMQRRANTSTELWPDNAYSIVLQQLRLACLFHEKIRLFETHNERFQTRLYLRILTRATEQLASGFSGASLNVDIARIRRFANELTDRACERLVVT